MCYAHVGRMGISDPNGCKCIKPAAGSSVKCTDRPLPRFGALRRSNGYLPCMRAALLLLFICGLLACKTPHVEQDLLRNTTMREHVFLPTMQRSANYPAEMVNQCDATLLHLCIAIENDGVKGEEDLYPITDHFIWMMNKLLDDFERQGITLGPAEREELTGEFVFIAKTYGFKVEVARMMAPQEW